MSGAAVSFDAMVSQLVGMGFPREKAEAKAREQHPDVAASLDGDQLRNAHLDEKREQRAITRMARAIHFKVYNLSQARAAKQTPGIGDLFMTLEAIGFAAWWETKRQVGGERSTAQEEFAAECLAARIPYGFGDRYHFAEFLKTHGFTPPVIPVD